VNNRILISPLDWGLGHASRCIPIIRYLLQKGCEVIIGADGRPLELLKREFPGLEHVVMPGYNISYPGKGSMILKMAASVPKIRSGIKKEHALLEKLISEKKIGAVISDNRFGLWSSQVPCVFITHQLMIKSPFGEKLLHQLNKSYISKFKHCWIPDTEGEDNLSGDLAHRFPLPANARFIGLLSRFERPGTAQPAGSHHQDILALLSGPEPQRSILEKKIIAQLNPRHLQALIVQGITEKKDEVADGKTRIVSHLLSADLEAALSSSACLICRPGYSTIMDLAVLQKKNIVFIPTPGQTEQEYLAERLLKNGTAYAVPQDRFDLEVALKEAKSYKGFSGHYFTGSFRKAVDELLGG
jgi:UDP:flavonoid glycosyltransferase YjiC (YdhE family)